MQRHHRSEAAAAPPGEGEAAAAAARAADARASFGGDGVHRALDILSIPRVRQAPLSQRIAVLESQGFSEKEISVAIRLSDDMALRQKATASRGPACAGLSAAATGGESTLEGGGAQQLQLQLQQHGPAEGPEPALQRPPSRGSALEAAAVGGAGGAGRWQALQSAPWPSCSAAGVASGSASSTSPALQPHCSPTSSGSVASIYAGTAPWPLLHVQQHQQPQRVLVPGAGEHGPSAAAAASEAAFVQLLAQQWQDQQQLQQQQQQQQQSQQQQGRHYSSPQRFHHGGPQPPSSQPAPGGQAGYGYRGPRPQLPTHHHQQQQQAQPYGAGGMGGGGRGLHRQDYSPLNQHMHQHHHQQQHHHGPPHQHQMMRHRSPLPTHHYAQQHQAPHSFPGQEDEQRFLAARMMRQQQAQAQAQQAAHQHGAVAAAAAAAAARMELGVDTSGLDAAELAMLAAAVGGEGAHGAFPLGLGFPRHARRREAKRLRKAKAAAGGGMDHMGMMMHPQVPFGYMDAGADAALLMAVQHQHQQHTLQYQHQHQQHTLQYQHQHQPSMAPASAAQLHQAQQQQQQAQQEQEQAPASGPGAPPDDALPWYKTIASGRVQKHLMRFVNNFISQKDLEDELGLYMADVFYETETGPTMAALYEKLERRVAERCPAHVKAFRAEALVSLSQLMAACEEREEQQERGREALKSSGQRGKPVRNAAKRLGKSRTEARKLGAMIAHYSALTLQEEEGGHAEAAQVAAAAASSSPTGDGGVGEEEEEKDTKADGKERPPGLPSPTGAAAEVGAEGGLLAAFAGLKMLHEGQGKEGGDGPKEPEPSPSETTMALLSSNSSSDSSSASSSLSGAA